MYPHPHQESARLKDPNKLPHHLVLKRSMYLHHSPTEVHPLQAHHLADGGVILGNAVIYHPEVWRVTVDQPAAIDIQRAVSAP
jgi:hypothetical protein